jgi:hypothetical protein
VLNTQRRELMTRLIGTVMAVALLVSVAPALAGDSFQALSRLPAGLSPLDDAQLAAVEGGYGFEFCVDCTNMADVKDHRDHMAKDDKDHRDLMKDLMKDLMAKDHGHEIK